MSDFSDDDPAMRPILLIGPGRSGTNLIAMTLGADPAIRNVYEQRYVWMKGMASLKSDLRHPDDATPATRAYIRAHFARQGQGGLRVMDKTPGNALRLEFCLRVFPQARIINVIRNPLDNIASRIVEWQQAGQSIEGGDRVATSRSAVLRQRLDHARRLYQRGNIPLDRLPRVLIDQIPEKIRIALTGKPARYAERVPGLPEIMATRGIVPALCHQWRELTMAATRSGRELPAAQYMEMRYEDACLSPEATGARLAEFVGSPAPEAIIAYMKANARPQTVGNWKKRLTRDQSGELLVQLKQEMAHFGYEAPA